MTLLAILFLISLPTFAIFGNDDEENDKSPIEKMDYSGLSFRAIGPIMTDGGFGSEPQ